MNNARFFLAKIFFCLFFTGTYLSEGLAKEVILPTTVVQNGWRLERLNIDRITGHALCYHKKIRRAGLYRKFFCIGGGIVAVGGLVWFCTRLKKNEQEIPAEGTTIPPGPEISEQEYRRAMLALKREIVKDNKSNISLWGGIKQGINDGASIAFYSFVGSIVLAGLSSSWEKLWYGCVGLFSSGGQATKHEHLVKLVAGTLNNIIPEYEQACSRALADNVYNISTLSFVSFLEQEIVKLHAFLIHALEELVALLFELQQLEVKKDQKLLRLLDDQMEFFGGIINSYTDALEYTLNAPIDDRKVVACKKIFVLIQHISDQVVIFCESYKKNMVKA